MGCGRLVSSLTSASLGLLLIVHPTVSSADDNCQQLEAISQQYAGVELTAVQKKMKRRMVAWYYKNCRTHRSAESN
jgi:hypothetical protein